MNSFTGFLREGFYHILDYSSFDHLLFVAALTIGFQRKEFSKLIVLLTAFTVGHAITLALAVTDNLFMESRHIEFLIPLTIVITGVYHLTKLNSKEKASFWIYALTIIFGIIHGMGYSSALKSMSSEHDSLTSSILAFNLGVELGMLIAAFIIYKAGRLIKRLTGISDKSFKAFTAGVVISFGLMFLWQNRFWI